MGKILTDAEFDALPAEPRAKRVLTDAEFDALPQTAAAPATKTAPPAADDTAHPSFLASAIQGLGEGVGVGPAARRMTATIKTIGDDVGAGHYLDAATRTGKAVLGPLAGPLAFVGPDTYSPARLAEQEARTRGAATDHPESYAPAKIAGGVGAALTLNPATFAAMAGGNTLAEGGTVGDAAQSAALSYGLGKMGGGTGIARLAPAVVGGYGAAKTAMDPNVPSGDRWAAAGEGALAAILPALAKRKATKAAAQGAESMRAAKDTVAAARENIDTEIGQASKENIARTGLAEADQNQRMAAANDANRATTQETLGKRADAYDKTAATYRNAVETLAAKRKAENDTHRLGALDHADDMATAQADYDTAKAVWDDHVARQADIADKAAAAAQRARALRDEHGKLAAAHAKEQERVAAQVKDLEDLGAEGADGVDASIAGKIGEMFRETHTRLDNLIRGSATHGLPVNPEYVDLHKYLTATLNKNTPRKVADLLEFRRDPKAWIAKERAAQDGQARTHDAPAPGSDELPPAPPTMADAQKSLDAKDAAKAYVHPDDAPLEMAADKAAKDLDAARAAKPVRPDDSEHQQAMRDFERSRILAGKAPLPPKPDSITKRWLDRHDRAKLSAATAANKAAPQTVARSDPGLLMPVPTHADVADRARTMLGEGRANVQATLDRERVMDPHVARDIGTQFARETRNPVVGHVARVGGGILGGAALGSLAGHADLGAVAGAALGHSLAGKAPSVVTKFLKSTADGRAYAEPANAHAVLEAGTQRLSAADLRRREVARATAMAAQEEARKKKEAARGR